MIRKDMVPRPDWPQKMEELGFSFHSIDGIYWDERACYEFTAAEIDTLEEATAELHEMCIEAAGHVIDSGDYGRFAIPAEFVPLIERSWNDDEATLFGRFDFSWDGSKGDAGAPKLLEYNADTPTSLIEASVAQWYWMQEVVTPRRAQADQFNSLHEKLIARLKSLQPAAGGGVLNLTCVKDNDEDLGNVEYLRDCALQAGWDARRIDIEDIGWDGAHFVDNEERPIATLFKLYPWEWLVRESFGEHLIARPVALIEPAWKMLLSNKALLVLLWELNYGHPNLLPSYFSPQKFGADYVKKPLLSREGANVTIRSRGVVRRQPGVYGNEGFVYQSVARLPAFDGRYPVIGAWIVGDEPAGIGIREDDSPITKNSSRFVPHYFT